MYYLVMKFSKVPPHRFAKSAIVYANYAQFGPEGRVLNPRVRSRMILWCKAGTGEVTVNGTTHSFEAGRYLLLPWNHAVSFRASREDPFLVAGIHLIPWHSLRHPITFEVAHNDWHPLARASFRHDEQIPEMIGVKAGWLNDNPVLTHLAEYIVNLFIRGETPEWLARQLAQQLFVELVQSQERNAEPDRGSALEIERIRQYVVARLNQPLSLRDLVEFSRLSPSTVGRLFREHLQMTPVSWIMRLKMERAQLLLRSRRLSVNEVGGQVGFSDPYYFSKCFKKATGLSPRDYRRKNHWI
jgi:AraC-like DNA-binding protein